MLNVIKNENISFVVFDFDFLEKSRKRIAGAPLHVGHTVCLC
jgi:hypothetical protein